MVKSGICFVACYGSCNTLLLVQKIILRKFLMSSVTQLITLHILAEVTDVGQFYLVSNFFSSQLTPSVPSESQPAVK